MKDISERSTKSNIPCFFAASNSGRGFVSYFGEVFANDKYKKVYVLKGGPGTGKSSLMKKAARLSREKGYECEGVLCSSDPDSYDGVIISRPECKIAILDGTAPHVREAEIPGAVDEIINLGRFWDAQLLSRHKDEIVSLCRQKSECYSCAYSILKCAFEYSEYKRKLIGRCIDRQKLEKAVSRLIPSHTSCISAPEVEYKLRSAISVYGPVSTDIYTKEDGTHISVYGSHDASFAVLDEIKKRAQQKKLSLTLSPTPLAPNIYDAIALPEQKLYFHDSGKKPPENQDKAIHSERFLCEDMLRQIKPTLRMLSRLCSDAMDSAYQMLSKAKEYHFAIEDIYVNAMDFAAKEEMEEHFFENIL